MHLIVPQNIKQQLGFTLVEILVVISIIGIIAAAALASMSDSRLAAREAAVIEQARQMMFVAQLSFNDNGDYADVNRAFIVSCDEFDTGDYQDENRRMCQRILDNGGALYSGAAKDRGPGCCAYEKDVAQHSVLVRLPGTVNEYFCISSNGSIFRGIWGENPDPAEGGFADVVYDSNPLGCPLNP